MGQRLIEIVETGRRNGRFNVSEVEVALRAIFGLVIATIHGAEGVPTDDEILVRRAHDARVASATA